MNVEFWRQRNAEARLAGCPCGKPATEVRRAYHYGPEVPVETWTCAEHVGVNVWERHEGEVHYRPGRGWRVA